MAVNIDQLKARAMQLGFKKSTSGLSAAEERELLELQQKIAMANVGL